MTISPKQLLQQVLVCLTFYTRLPAGRWLSADTDFAAAQWAAPIAGLVVGAIGAAILLLAHGAGLGPQLAAALCVAATIAVTGALHEDGAADTADGFGGGKTAGQKLDIMRDSRIGTYGTLTLILIILIRWSAIASLAHPASAALIVVAAHMASRALFPAFLILVKPARSDGLSAGISVIGPQTAIIALIIGLSALLASGLAFTAIAAGILLGWFFALKTICERQIGGHTGDVMGALQQGGEMLILITAILLAS